MYNQASIYKGGGVYNLGDGASTKLPAKTFRFLFSNPDYDPTVAGVGSGGTWQKVDTAAANVWDYTFVSNTPYQTFEDAFKDGSNLVEIIAAGDTSSITSFTRVFRNCSSLTKICLFDTSNITSLSIAFSGCSKLEEIPLFNTGKCGNFYETFSGCSKLKHIPLFNTSVLTGCSGTFDGCVSVESGALDLYKQMSTQTTPPVTTTNCFRNCGNNTTTGAEELAQIPASWGGTMAALNISAPQNLTEPLSPSVIDDGDDSLTK